MEDRKKNILIVGKKIGMTQLYDNGGHLLPVTVVEACAGRITKIKTSDSKDGYSAIQIGFCKADLQVDSKNEKIGFDFLRELRVDDVDGYELNSSIGVKEFSSGDMVDVVGTTKGKGFQGVMKRHGFGGGPASHGSMFHRRGGSYGQRQWPGHVFKGRKMPGHDGDVSRTAQNLKIVGVNAEKRLLIISGSFPGTDGGYVTIRRAKKSGFVACRGK